MSGPRWFDSDYVSSICFLIIILLVLATRVTGKVQEPIPAAHGQREWVASRALCGGRAPCSRVHQQCSEGVLVWPPTFQVLSAPVLEPRTLYFPSQCMVKPFGHNLKIDIVNSQQKVENHISDLVKSNIERVKHESSVLHPSLTCVAQFSESETSPEVEFQVIIWLCDKLGSKPSFFYCSNFDSIMFYWL